MGKMRNCCQFTSTHGENNILICWAFFFFRLFWSQKIPEMYVDPKVDDNEVKGSCLDVLKSYKKGFISYDSTLIND